MVHQTEACKGTWSYPVWFGTFAGAAIDSGDMTQLIQWIS